MEITTVLLIVLAAMVALGMVLFQYFYRSKRRGRLPVLLSFLRFIGLFSLFLLLINPEFSKNEYTIEKTKLVVLTDNSASIAEARNQVVSMLAKIDDNDALAEKFDIQHYQFAVSLKEGDSLSFGEKNTNIANALASIKDIYSTTNTAVVLLTDGSQTFGADYAFQGSALKFPVFPVVIGDTTRYEDLRVDQINVNKYAFLKNKFPIEAFISYQGSTTISTALSITVNGQSVYRETIKLSKTDNTRLVNTLVDATTIGVKSVVVSLQPLENERNVVNNTKSVAVEVIDEKTNIAIISDILHPDIGVLTKAIESNEQRSVILMKSNSKPKDLEDIDVFVLYQPTSAFNAIIDYTQQKKASNFIIGGNKTDWAFLNRTQNQLQVEEGYPNQEISPLLNLSFSKFDITGFSLDDFPPLESDAGNTLLGADSEVLMTMMIRGAKLGNPLMFVSDEQGIKQAVLLGENIWKWRMQSYRNDQNFDNFDSFIGKLVLYLATNKSKNRLNIEYDRIYDGSSDAKITATYFDEAFVFDTNASIFLKATNKDQGVSKEVPMLLKGSFYEVDLIGLPAGDYAFTITVKDQNLSKSGNFTILDFNIEQQLLSTDYKKLQQLATASNGQLFFPSQIDSLLLQLNTSQRFLPTQKGVKNIVPLIDFRMLMALIIGALSLEWFIRKYNGLI
ncbi:MAG: VWA domain-containing protein [Flavobacteriaceae bacterium]